VNQSSLAQAILKHWQEFRPKMCAELQKKDLLYRSELAAAGRTADLLVSLQQDGLSYDQAKEIAYREWYLLADEEEQPSLTFDPDRLQVELETDEPPEVASEAGNRYEVNPELLVEEHPPRDFRDASAADRSKPVPSHVAGRNPVDVPTAEALAARGNNHFIAGMERSRPEMGVAKPSNQHW
jgi:hypothetical protein